MAADLTAEITCPEDILKAEMTAGGPAYKPGQARSPGIYSNRGQALSGGPADAQPDKSKVCFSN